MESRVEKKDVMKKWKKRKKYKLSETNVKRKIIRRAKDWNINN